jgi:tetratricopeptide (TPR) repeat protein
MSNPAVFKIVRAIIELSDIYTEFPDLEAKPDSERNNSISILLKERFKGKSQHFEVSIVGPKIEIKWAIPKNPPEVEGLNKKAIQFARKKDFTNAFESWQNAIAKSPADPDYRYNLGLALYESKEYQRCVEQLEETVSNCPLYYRAYFVLGNIYSKMRQFESAAMNLKKGLLFQNGNISGLINLGAVYSIQKQFKNAVPVFEKCISLSPKESRAYLGLGKIYAIMGDADNANRCFKAVIKIEPDGKLGAIAKRSLLIKSQIDNDTADTNLSADALYSEGYQAYIKGDYQSTVKYYKSYLKINPNDVDILAALASSQLRLGDFVSAMSLIERAIGINSNKPALFKQAAIIYDVSGRGDKAKIAAEKALEMGKRDSVILTIMGKSFAANGKGQESLKFLSEAIKLNPNNINARYHLARTLSMMGQKDSARQNFEEILWSKFETPLKEKAQKEIDALL